MRHEADNDPIEAFDDAMRALADSTEPEPAVPVLFSTEPAPIVEVTVSSDPWGLDPDA